MDHRISDGLDKYLVGIKYLENNQILVQFLSDSKVKFQLILSKDELKNLSNFLYP